MTSRLKGTLRGLKRSEILERGSHLFYQQGFSRTGVSEITDAAGVPKGSFYNYFDSKADFGIECLRDYEEHWTRELETALCESGEAPLKHNVVSSSKASSPIAPDFRLTATCHSKPVNTPEASDSPSPLMPVGPRT